MDDLPLKWESIKSEIIRYDVIFKDVQMGQGVEDEPPQLNQRIGREY